MWWGVKTWRVDIESNVGGSVSSTTSVTNEDNVFPPKTLNSERDLICLEEIDFSDFDVPTFYSSGSFFVGYFVYLFIETGGEVSSVSTKSYFWDYNENTFLPNGEQIGNLTLAAFGKTYILPLYIGPTEPGSPPSGEEMDVAITAIEYWPYDPNDGGGPIYSTTTGAQLRDFPG